METQKPTSLVTTADKRISYLQFCSHRGSLSADMLRRKRERERCVRVRALVHARCVREKREKEIAPKKKNEKVSKTYKVCVCVWVGACVCVCMCWCVCEGGCQN